MTRSRASAARMISYARPCPTASAMRSAIRSSIASSSAPNGRSSRPTFTSPMRSPRRRSGVLSVWRATATGRSARSRSRIDTRSAASAARTGSRIASNCASSVTSASAASVTDWTPFNRRASAAASLRAVCARASSRRSDSSARRSVSSRITVMTCPASAPGSMLRLMSTGNSAPSRRRPERFRPAPIGRGCGSPAKSSRWAPWRPRRRSGTSASTPSPTSSSSA